MVASTNHLDKLDAGLSSRPSRFDRKYLFPLPSEHERTLYCQYWRTRLQNKKVDVEFPPKICPAVAIITDGFSFAYLQEAFVASLLAIAQRRSEGDDGDSDEDVDHTDEDEDGKVAVLHSKLKSNDISKHVVGGGDDHDKDLNDYELWRQMKRTVKALRDDMGKGPDKPKDSNDQENAFEAALAKEKEAQTPRIENGLHTHTKLPSSAANTKLGESRGIVPMMAEGDRPLIPPVAGEHSAETSAANGAYAAGEEPSVTGSKGHIPRMHEKNYIGEEAYIRGHIVKGKAVKTDNQNVPLIMDEGGFIYEQ